MGVYEGRHYTDSIAYETRRLFYEPRFLDMCRKYAASYRRVEAGERKGRADV